MNTESERAGSVTSPIGRGRIALAIRVRGYGLTMDRNPSPPPSPLEVGYIRLRQFGMPNSGIPELGGSDGAPNPETPEHAPRRKILSGRRPLGRSDRAWHAAGSAVERGGAIRG